MKQSKPSAHKKKVFLKIPEYPGGKAAFLKFINDNIVYPAQAITDKTEGLVHLTYTVNNIGEIVDIEVTKGIGSGCDEEAVRVISMLKYEPVRNRGVKMKARMKTRISFQLPVIDASQNSAVNLAYSVQADSKTNNPEKDSRVIYNYTIKF